MRIAGSALLALVLLAGCASSRDGKDDLPPVPIPKAESEALNPPAAPSDARLSELQTQLTELLERIDVLNARIAKLESTAGGQAPSPVPPSPAAGETGQARAPVLHNSAPSGATKLADLADAYRNALMLFGRGRHAEARAAFEKVFAADPNGELADNALYWIGETYYAAGDYSNALRYYNRVAKEYGDQNKAPDAMFKMALAYVKTGDLAMARRTFEECIQKYPYSASAASAKLELKRIKY
jgi:tol-pal system protein YbgF